MDAKEVLSVMGTDPEMGLSSKTAEKRLEKFGKNEIEVEKKRGALEIFIDQFKDPLVMLLIFALFISALLGETKDALLIGTILTINAVLGFFQEYKAEKTLEELKKLMARKAKVIRDGKLVEIDASLLVPGDIVIVEEGDVVPADLRLIEVNNFAVDESMLTGESIPVEKSAEKLPEDTVLAERKNMAFMNTIAVKGKAKGVVVATGKKTVVGEISQLAAGEKEKKMRLEIELERFGKVLTNAILLISLLIFLLFFIKNPGIKGAVSALLLSVSLAVAAVPEGLPAIVTASLSAGVARMARKKALVRRLKSIEALGAVDVICVDKTGTLTKNRLEVVEHVGDLKKLEEISHFCHSASLETGVGDPVDIAVAKFGSKYIGGGKKVREIPFSSERKMMSVLVEKDDGLYLYVKGAPEVVLSICSISESEKRFWKEKTEELARKGLKVIGLAWKKCDSKECKEKELRFAGLLGLLDPPREGVKEAVERARRAGVKVVMITGDHPETAKAIADMLGFEEGLVLSGKELEKMSFEELAEIVDNVSIFARVEPKHKLKIVKAFQSRQHLVAMTGDGVNDAPALKQADIGIAMGSGTEVAKEAADIILLDNSFEAIVSAIEEGRRIFRNIKNSIVYLLSSNLGEVIAISAAAFLNKVLLEPVHLLWMNLLTDGLPALGIAFDPAEKDVLEKPPRKEKILEAKDANLLLSIGLILAISMLLLFFSTQNESKGRSLALFGFVLFEISTIPIIRGTKLRKNYFLAFAVLSSILLQLIATYRLWRLLSLVPLTWVDLIFVLVVVAGSVVILKALISLAELISTG